KIWWNPTPARRSWNRAGSCRGTYSRSWVMAVDAKQIRQWSDELARLALLPGSDALAEALDLCLAVETEAPRTAPLAASENSVKMAEICLRYLTVRPALL